MTPKTLMMVVRAAMTRNENAVAVAVSLMSRMGQR